MKAGDIIDDAAGRKWRVVEFNTRTPVSIRKELGDAGPAMIGQCERVAVVAGVFEFMGAPQDAAQLQELLGDLNRGLEWGAGGFPMAEPAAAAQLPLYKCHKEVRALKIKRIDVSEPGDTIWLEFYEPGFPRKAVHADFLRHSPAPGGYFLVYEDGYQSFSLAKTFEEGYTLAGE
jgi:hypothetical protein